MKAKVTRKGGIYLRDSDGKTYKHHAEGATVEVVNPKEYDNLLRTGRIAAIGAKPAEAPAAEAKG